MEDYPGKRSQSEAPGNGEPDRRSASPGWCSIWNKRRRVIQPTLMDDMAMTDLLPAPVRRPRSPPLNLVNLPVDCLKRVLCHVSSSSRTSQISTASALASALPVRLVCKYLCAAFDAHVVHFDFTGLSSHTAVSTVILRALPRFSNLTKLTLNELATDRAFVHHWAELFVRAPLHIRIVQFHGASALSTVPGIIAAGCGPTVEDVSVVTSIPTTSTAILSCFAQHCPFVRTIDARLDGVDSRVLAGFSSLRSINILFRTAGVSLCDMQMLAWALSQCSSTLESVDLRVHDHQVVVPMTGNPPRNLEQEPLCLLSHLPRLRKLSLFSMRGWPVSLPGWLSTAHYLRELCLEWCDDVRDADLEEVTRLLGPRLQRARVWNCNALTDEALRSLAQNTDPCATLDLSFRRDQFSLPVLCALGHRAVWESWGGPVASADASVVPMV
jgi:hypothetical protein